jgi:hypothetical protein
MHIQNYHHRLLRIQPPLDETHIMRFLIFDQILNFAHVLDLTHDVLSSVLTMNKISRLGDCVRI